VCRVHYSRLVEAALLQDHEVILECYHPSVKISTPTLFCNYLSTDGLEEAGHGEVGLRTLNGLYSRFRPVLGEDGRRPRARYPTRDVLSGTEPPLEEVPSHDLHLDAGELFSQLCTVASLIKVGPRRGLFLSISGITDSVIRVWRDWLQQEAARSSAVQRQADPSSEAGSVLWTDSTETVGLRVLVTEKDDLHAPVLMGVNDEPPVSYTLEYKGACSWCKHKSLFQQSC
jgi:hypothetical protein